MRRPKCYLSGDNLLETPEKEGDFAKLLAESLRRTDFGRVLREKTASSTHLPCRKVKSSEITEQNTRTVDLHGLSKPAALAIVQRTLVQARLNNETALIIITGKGNNSPNGPVLRPAVFKMIVECKQKGIIRHHQVAPDRLGGEGAFIVYL